MKMTYADSGKERKSRSPVRYAFIEEPPGELASRLNARQTKIKGAGPNDLEPFQSALVGVFQYMIGNTDFAFGALHNIELMQMANGDYLPIAYDFDFSGAVNARYATVDPQLRNRTVRDRALSRLLCPERGVSQGVRAVQREKGFDLRALRRLARRVASSGNRR